MLFVERYTPWRRIVSNQTGMISTHSLVSHALLQARSFLPLHIVVRTDVCMCVCVYVCMYVCIYVLIYLYMYYVCMYCASNRKVAGSMLDDVIGIFH
jgi:hypothetical protein